jgi:hypothetical protein
MKLYGSSAGRWQPCPGSIKLSELYPVLPDDDSNEEERAEGIAAHWAGEELLRGELIAVGQIAKNGVPLTDEMIEGAELYAEVVGDEIGHIEQRLIATRIHPENICIPDHFVYNPVERVIRVHEYKFGHGFVEVFENWQLIDNVAAIMDSLNINGHDDQHIDVEMTVVQPRSYHRDGPVRTWRVRASELRGYHNKLRASAEATMHLDAPVTVGNQCKNCPARHVCPALQRAALSAIDESERSTPLELTPEALGLELRMVQRAQKMLSARSSGLEAAVLATFRKGVIVPGYRAEQGKGRKAWTKPASDVISMAKMLGVDVAKPPEAMTPAQAIKAGMPVEVVEAIAKAPTGEMKAVPDDGSLARKVFGNVK